MNRTLLGAAVAALVIGHPGEGWAQHQNRNVTLHLSDRWDECAFQLDPALTQDAWRQFTEEAGLVAYFRPLADARPLGRGRVELSLMQWATAIDDTDAAWNDTFVHPTADHWLFDGSRLPIPALSVRVGVGDRTDVGAVFTKNPNANYGFFGGLVQQNFIDEETHGWSGAGRLNFVSLFGPEDLSFTVLGFDVVASKSFPVTSWLTLAPYIGGASYLAYAREHTLAVNLDDEIVPASQGMIGAVAELSRARLAVEWSNARVHTLSLRAGVGF
ncbi:MAG: hypothetical protein OEO79_15205 [Gemmatimonadota bacterium]|nr:hypothetical protein [Gemmatimonadota bacterium]